jgi:hypothetical protein
VKWRTGAVGSAPFGVGILKALESIVRWLLWSVQGTGGQTLAPLSVGSISPQVIPQHGCVPAEPASVSRGKVIVAPPRGLLKCERHRLEIKSRLVCLLQEIYAEIPVEEFAGFGSVCQQDSSGAEDYQESPDAEMQ